MTDLLDLRERLDFAYRKALRSRRPMWARRMVMLLFARRRGSIHISISGDHWQSGAGGSATGSVSTTPRKTRIQISPSRTCCNDIAIPRPTPPSTSAQEGRRRSYGRAMKFSATAGRAP